jgi:hypothetical protein
MRQGEKMATAAELSYWPHVLPLFTPCNAPSTWSLMISADNWCSYLHETLTSVISPSVRPVEMQIQLIDDCSNIDDLEAMVQELVHRGFFG